MNADTPSDRVDGLLDLRNRLRAFAAERDWEKFHSPKNIAIALSVEASELLERFQWLTEAESRSLPSSTLAQVREEMADVLLYLVILADKLDVNLADASRMKLEANALKYPVESAHGNSRKYTDF